MRKYKVGLVVGRFQPFHKGHVYLLQQALKIAENIIIGLGSSNITNEDNPFTVQSREEMLHKVIAKEKFTEKVIQIVEIPDVPDDNKWLSITLEKVVPFDVVIGNNEWVNGIFKNASYPVVTIPYLNREFLEGKKIRTLIEEKKQWEERVPSYLIGHIKNGI